VRVYFVVSAFLLALLACLASPAKAAPVAQGEPFDEALVAPERSSAQVAGAGGLRGPSQFMAGDVAVLVVLPESNGAAEPSREDWTPAQIETVRAQVQQALDWWAARLPLAGLRFQVRLQVVPTDYEPTSHGLDGEGLWIGDSLRRLGFDGPSYFDQAYYAADALRDELGADWGTVLFVPNSSSGSGYLADGRFAYAYINGPFLVVTSNGGGYGANKLAHVVAHELGHTFGALDQYAGAKVGCDRSSGYLNAPSTNSQYNGCGTRNPSIMLEAIGAFGAGLIDESALHQIGYRDSDGDGVIDPLDTAPAVELEQNSLASSTARPVIRGVTRDVPFPSTYQNDVTLHTVSAVEFRVDGGAWLPAVPVDGAFDSADEAFSAELPLYDGSYSVEVRARNSAGATSAIVTRAVEVTWIGPAPQYKVGGPAITASPAITLQLDAPATTQGVQVSEDPSFAAAAWQPYSPALGHELAPGEGQRTLYVRFRDQFDLASLPAAVPVVLDTQPPQGSAVRSPATPERLVLDATDESSAVTEVEVTVGAEAPRWLPYAPSVELAPGAGAVPVMVRFRDAAGNISQPSPAASGYAVSLPLVHR
jgi:hypothetical protein